MSLAFRKRPRSNSLSAVPPSQSSTDYSIDLAEISTRILYRSPLPSQSDLPVYILNSAAFPDSNEVDFDSLLPYVLSRLPSDDQLIGGKGYEVIFFAGGEGRGSSEPKKTRPGWGWFLQAYHVLSRAMRKRLQKLYLVHEKRWIRVMSETFSTIVSPKFRRKVVHVSSMSALALYVPIDDLLIPPSAYDCDRRFSPDIHVPYVTGRRAFGTTNPMPNSVNGEPRLPRVLRETSLFILDKHNIETEGLFRVNARALTLEILREAYDRGQKFIVWREGDVVMSSSHWKEGSGEVSIDEIVQADGYSINAAAGLVKLWYSDLREPIFPSASYPFIERLYGSSGKAIETPVLLDLIGIPSAWSPLSRNSRMILTKHLIPLLARVAAHAQQNKMSPHNLAVCFAPSLLCGPDPVVDAKMAGIISKIIQFSIEHWQNDLAEACGMSGHQFEESIQQPKSIQDREDPLDSVTVLSLTRNDQNQTQGIILLDNDDSKSESEEEEEEEAERPPLPPRIDAEKPPLPPRINTGSSAPIEQAEASSIRRKPAPPLQNPPRYSTVIDLHDGTHALPTYAESASASSAIAEANDVVASTAVAPSATSPIARKPLPSEVGAADRDS